MHLSASFSIRCDNYIIVTKMAFSNYFARRFLNLNERYKGPFIVKEYLKKPKNEQDLIKIMDDFRKIASETKVIEPSPLLVAFRFKPMSGSPWPQKVILRRLGLHSQMFDTVIIPNTPHFHKLLREVKHLVHVKPIIFTNGFPTEKDIGATRLCPFTGKFEINETFRVSNERLEGDEIQFFYKNHYLRNYLRKQSGLFAMSFA